MSHKSGWLFTFCIMIILCMPLTLFAVNTGKVVGVVTDAELGEALPGANIIVTGIWEKDKEAPIAAMIGASSGLDGYYYIINLKPGQYTFICQIIGYADLRLEKVVINNDRTTTLNFEMKSSLLSADEIVVIAEKEVIKQDISASKYYVKVDEIEAMPVEGLGEVLATQLGVQVQANAEGSGFQIRGGGINETDVLIDGISLMNERTGVPLSSINMTALEEIEILSGGFNAEYGTVRSGMINIITKDGSDKFSFSGNFRISPAHRKHFGPSPYAPDGPFWSVYAGDKAFTGVSNEDVESGAYPFEFIGWNQMAINNAKDNIPDNDFTPQEMLEIWKWRHREIEYADEPDYTIDLTLSGPAFFDNLKFMLAQRYENTQYYLPLSRKNYENSITQLKLSYQLNNKMKLRLNNIFNYEIGVGGGSVYNASPAALNGSREAAITESYMLNSPVYLWGESAFNPMENTNYVGSLNFSYIHSTSTFFDFSAEFMNDKTVQEPMPSRDTTGIKKIGNYWYDETPRGYDPTGGAEVWDQTNQSILSGLGRGENHSRYQRFKLAGHMVSQLNRKHQIKTGLTFSVSSFKERELVNSGGGQPNYEEFPQNWIYYDQTPIKIEAYIQDKIEFEGLIANIGIRLDYFNPRSKAFDLSAPFSRDELSGVLTDYEVLQTDVSTGKVNVSPRIGVSHPISTNAKLYFNYGHFFQIPHPSYYFNIRPKGGSNAENIIPNLTMDWPKTIQYEVGYEHEIAEKYLIHLGAYYKDVSNEIVPYLIKSGELGTGDVQIRTWRNNQYRDIRGTELRFEKKSGHFFTFFTNLQYMVTSTGQTGQFGTFEDQILIEEQRRMYDQDRPYPVPSVSANIDLHTPNDYGIDWGGFYPLGGWRLNTLFGWSDGGKMLYDPMAAPGVRQWVDIVDWSNTDMQIEKYFNIGAFSFTAYVNIYNLFDQKRLTNIQHYPEYLSSLKFPWETGSQNGTDKYGMWNEDYLKLGWYSWTQFLNPRSFYFGLRVFI